MRDEICSLAVEQHPNFAVGVDGFLVHNDTCWKDLITQITGRAVPAALSTPALVAKVHGHHIVMKTVTNDARGVWIQKSQDILNRFGIPLLGTKAQVRAQPKVNGKAVLDNLCYAANSYQEIHGEAYVKAVYTKLKNAVDEGATAAQKAQNIKTALQDMAAILEGGGKFW